MTPLVNLGDLLDRSRPAGATALIDCLDWERPREYSFGEIDRLANACARGLLAHGLTRGDAVAILAGNRAEFLIAYFGTMRAGLVSVPVNHKFSRETLEFVLRDSGARLVFCDGERRAQVPAGIPLVDFDSTEGDGFAALLDPGGFAVVRPEPRETAMVLYTSGSTGRPKGVPLSHDGHLWAVRSRVAAGRDLDRERFLVAAPLFHMNALGTSKVVFAAHAAMVLLPQFDARLYVEAIGRFGVTFLTSVPTMLALILREKDLLARTDLSSVRAVPARPRPQARRRRGDPRREPR